MQAARTMKVDLPSTSRILLSGEEPCKILDSSGLDRATPSISTTLVAVVWIFGTILSFHLPFLRFTQSECSNLSVKAFQRLWNRKNPSAKIGEDGIYGPATERAILRVCNLQFLSFFIFFFIFLLSWF